MEKVKAFLIKYKIQLSLVAVMLVVLWPLSLFIYIPKWDNIDCYLPYRYFVSYSFHQGEWPFWNPFQMFGYPAYSDMQNGMYSPIVWLIMLFGKYNVSSLTIELLTYYVIGIFGAYKFSKLYLQTTTARILVALAFGLSGFMMSTSQIMIFISGAAFLPHILYHFILFFRTNSILDIFYFILFVGLQVTSASPAYSIVLCYILFSIFIYYVIKTYRSNKEYAFHWWKVGIAGLGIILILLPYINSVVEFLPYFGRAKKLEYSDYLLSNPFDLMEYISFLLPSATLSDSGIFGNTDLTMRSAYIGIIPLIFTFLSLKFWRDQKVKWLWIGVIIFLILAAGGHTPLYYLFCKLPGFGLFRHPAIFRAHAILFMVVLAGIAYERIDFQQARKLLLISAASILAIFSVVLIVSLFKLGDGEIKALFSNWNHSKNPVSHSISAHCFITSLLLIPLIGAAIWIVYKKPEAKKYLLIIILLDLVIYSQMTSKWTIHYPEKQSAYNAHFKQLPKEIDQHSATVPYKNLHENYEPKIAGLWRNTATYNLSLTYDGHNQTQFIHFNEIENNRGLKVAKENPLFYEIKHQDQLNKCIDTVPNQLWRIDNDFKGSVNHDSIIISEPNIEMNGFKVKVNNPNPKKDLLVLNQNYHHLWKAFVDSKEVHIYRANDAFMAIEIPAMKKVEVEFKFSSPRTKWFMWISFFSYLLLFGSIIYYVRKFRDIRLK